MPMLLRIIKEDQNTLMMYKPTAIKTIHKIPKKNFLMKIRGKEKAVINQTIQ